MDATRFEQLARNPALTRQELENMKENAISRDKNELADIADAVLRERFPIKTKKVSGWTPTKAIFRGRSEKFSTGKDAYLWLVEQFRNYHPSVFEEYEKLYKKARSKGKRFARNPDTLFPPDSKHTDNQSHYSELPGGWFTYTNINHEDKFKTLDKLGSLSKLEYKSDWDFDVEGGTEELVEKQATVALSNELLSELSNA